MNTIQEWSHTMTKQLAERYANKESLIKRAKIELKLILLADEVGLTEILKERWNSSGPKERLDCLDLFKHETEKYYLSF